MSSALGYVLILWAVVVVTGAVIFALRRTGVMAEPPRTIAGINLIGASYGLVLGLMTFFASQHQSAFRDTAQDEATAVAQGYVMARSLPGGDVRLARSQEYCYAEDVIDREWPEMGRGNAKGDPAVDAREAALYAILLRGGLDTPKPKIWYQNAVSSALDAGQARLKRLQQSERQIPDGIWVLIYFGAALLLVLIAWYHLARRRQGLALLTIFVLMLTAVVAVLAGLDTPARGPFKIEPTAMKQTRSLLGKDLGVSDPKRFCAALPAPAAGTIS
jgi:hypothetical protein